MGSMLTQARESSVLIQLEGEKKNPLYVYHLKQVCQEEVSCTVVATLDPSSPHDFGEDYPLASLLSSIMPYNPASNTPPVLTIILPSYFEAILLPAREADFLLDLLRLLTTSPTLSPPPLSLPPMPSPSIPLPLSPSTFPTPTHSIPLLLLQLPTPPLPPMPSPSIPLTLSIYFPHSFNHFNTSTVTTTAGTTTTTTCPSLSLHLLSPLL
eukprot:TRINITY_DN2414_c0_g1_i3.p2 TRINITY_DN2414_c0_g1~~TRINITY_DN2414_c0_g1_i3.p2  ORF type:complete len:210 (+),score=40.45 TRINITY_DN2414_c0_g1_i3:1-630(+)